jgi:drug/metabolite transporter (DMT)-like permease
MARAGRPVVSRMKFAQAEMIGVIFLWGVSWPMGRAVATSGIGAASFYSAFLRYSIAIPFLYIFARMMHKSVQLPRAWIKELVIFGLLHVTIYNFLFLSSLRFTSSSDAVLILNSSISVLSALGASLVYADEKLTTTRIAGIFLTLIGVAIVFISSPNDDVANRVLGNVIILFAALAWSIYTVYSRPIYKEVPPLQFQLWSTIFGWIALGLIAIVELSVVTIQPIEISVTGALIYLGLFGAAIPNTLFSVSIDKIGPSRTTILVNFIPLISIISAVLLLGEVFSYMYLIAFAIMFAGVYLVNLIPSN